MWWMLRTEVGRRTIYGYWTLWRQIVLCFTVENIDAAIIQKIKKALALASHEDTSEDEARAALR
jgi:hypothetical protein